MLATLFHTNQNIFIVLVWKWKRKALFGDILLVVWKSATREKLWLFPHMRIALKMQRFEHSIHPELAERAVSCIIYCTCSADGQTDKLTCKTKWRGGIYAILKKFYTSLWQNVAIKRLKNLLNPLRETALIQPHQFTQIEKVSCNNEWYEILFHYFKSSWRVS